MPYINSCLSALRRYGAPMACALTVSLLLAGCVTGSQAEPAADEPAPPCDWPVVLQSDRGPVEIYQPQPQSLNGDVLSARAAVSLTPTGSTTPVFGAIWFTAMINTDLDTRMVLLNQITVTKAAFRNSTPAEEQQFAQSITALLSTAQFRCSRDRLMASLDTAQLETTQSKGLLNTPPQILFSTTPATLILINGSPRLAAMEEHPGMSRVVNTPFIVLYDQQSQRYFIKAGPRWVSSADVTGPYVDDKNVPAPIASVGNDLATPATQPANAPTPQIAAPSAEAQIIVATQATELVVTDGQPQFTAVPGAGGNLLYASNTTSRLFLNQGDQHYYILLSGRWYSSTSFQGPWQYVASDQLPPVFAQIPSDSAVGDVLTFVAKTPEAHEAVLDASIPQTAYIRRDAGSTLNVGYDGAPQFQDVPQCPGVAYAINTPEAVLSVNGVYYCCHQGVWYQSPSSAGPWEVSTAVPPVIYTLPPSCPDYNVVFAYVYDVGPDYVICGYLPGYTNSFIEGSTIVYGTGYDYPGWYGSVYFPPPCTWGFDAYYDPYAFGWGFDAGLYWGGFGWFCYPWHEGWWRDHPHEHWGWHRWWGPGGFVHAHDLRENFFNARTTGAFRRGEPGALGARMPGDDPGGAGWHNLYARGGNVARNVPADRQRSYVQAAAAAGHRDDLYAGSEGGVFRRSSGGWEASGGGGWTRLNSVPEAGSNYRGADSYRGFGSADSGLEQHYAARSWGGYRASGIQGYSGGYHGNGGFGGGFHGGGGGFHGGGGGGHR